MLEVLNKLKAVLPELSDYQKFLSMINRPYIKEIVFKLILNIINRNNSPFLIHGAGTHTEWVLRELDKVNINSYIKGIIDKNCQESFYDKKLNKYVYPLNYIKKNSNINIIIAHKYFEEEMFNDLLNEGAAIKHLFRVFTSLDYLELIYENLSKNLNSDIIFDSKKKKTVFIKVHQGIFNNDILKYLAKELDWQLVEINLQSNDKVILNDEFQVYQCGKNPIKMVKIIEELNPDLVIVEAHFDSLYYPVILINLIFPKLPIITSLYDIIIMHRENDKNRYLEYITEKYAIEKSRAIIHRTTEDLILYLKDKYNTKSKNDFVFQPFISKKIFVKIKRKHLSFPIKLVSAHNILNTDLARKSGGIESDVIGLYKTLLKQGFEIDIYFKGITKKQLEMDYSDYLELKKDYDNLNIFPGISQEEVLKILPNKYDFALTLYNNFESAPFGRNSLINYEIGGRIYFYLSIGLPVITTTFFKRQEAIINENKIGIAIHSSKLQYLNKFIDNVEYPKMQQNVLNLRNKLSLEYKRGELNKFIKGVLSD